MSTRPHATRATSLKTRIVAHKQQVVRIDRETRDSLEGPLMNRLLEAFRAYAAQGEEV